MKSLILLGIIGAVALLGVNTVKTDLSQPRGIRNNNPGNIDRGQPWAGLAPIQSDQRFAQFVHPVFGIRAIARIIKTYQTRNLDTIREIISTWAPPIENDTNAYVLSVEKRLKYNRDLPLTPEQLPALIAAIIQHENGQQPYSDNLIKSAILLAGVSLPSDFETAPVIELVNEIDAGRRNLGALQGALLVA